MNQPELVGYSSHMQAAKRGCPLCKQPLEALEAERTTDGWWKNYCRESGCRGVLEYTVNYETAAVAAEGASQKQEMRTRSPVIREDSPPVCEDWEYVYNLYEWMTVVGKVVPIKKLPEKEFVDSVWALVHVNFSKVGRTMAWVKQLPAFGAPYAYPKEALDVGARDAKDKLEEFYENAEERGWITPESG